MAWFTVALFAVPILATLWAIGFGIMTAREKKILWRFACGLLALVGVVYAAAGWYLLGSRLFSVSRGSDVDCGRPRLAVRVAR